MIVDAEKIRLDQSRLRQAHWKKWRPYFSERQWDMVREDCSDNGDAWNHFTHDQARSRAHRWGDDGLAGISDDHQTGCVARIIRAHALLRPELLLAPGADAAIFKATLATPAPR